MVRAYISYLSLFKVPFKAWSARKIESIVQFQKWALRMHTYESPRCVCVYLSLPIYFTYISNSFYLFFQHTRNTMHPFFLGNFWAADFWPGHATATGSRERYRRRVHQAAVRPAGQFDGLHASRCALQQAGWQQEPMEHLQGAGASSGDLRVRGSRMYTEGNLRGCTRTFRSALGTLWTDAAGLSHVSYKSFCALAPSATFTPVYLCFGAEKGIMQFSVEQITFFIK